MPESPFLPPRLRGRGYRSSRFALTSPAPVAQDDGGGGFFGTGIGPDIGLGLGTLFQEIGGGITGLARLAIPGSKAGEPGLAELGKGVVSSLAGTAGTVLPPFLQDPLFEGVEGLLGEDFRPQNLFERVQERGLLPALVEDIGNVSLVGAAATAPVRAAAATARVAGAPGAAARLAGLHGRMVTTPAIRAVQHPYLTAGRAVRGRVIAPAATRFLEAQGIRDVPLDAPEPALVPEALVPEALVPEPAALVPEPAALVPEAPATVSRATRILAGVEQRLKAREARQLARDQTRIADQERLIASRSPGIRASVAIARDQIIEAGKAQDTKISRHEATLIVGDEIRTRLEATGLLEQVGVTREMMTAAGIRGRLPIPDALRTPELTAALDDAADLTRTERLRIREVLMEGRQGTKGLEGLGADDAMLPEMTKGQKATLARADKMIARAQGDVLARKTASETLRSENLISTSRDKLGQIAEESQRLAQRADRALDDFEHSRTFVPRTWRTPEGLTQTAEAVVEATLASGIGASFSPHTGRFLIPGQTRGYAVSLLHGTAIRAARDAAVAAETGLEVLSPEHIVQLARAHQDIYQHPNTLVGTWIDPRGVVHIDPSELVPKLSDALIKAAERGQEAIYSMAGDVSLSVPRHLSRDTPIKAKDVPSGRTLAQEAARAPRFPQPPAGAQDFYRAGRRGQKALATLEQTAAKQKLLAASKANVEQTIKDIEAALQNQALPSQVERSQLLTDAARLSQKVREELGTPSISRTPARWQPLYEAVLKLGAEAAENPKMAEVLRDLPRTLQEIQDLSARNGFDPVHVRDFSPQQVRRLVFGNMRLGLGREGLVHELEAGTRKPRTRTLARAGGVDRSVEALLAASVEATNEARLNAVINWVEGTAARRISQGAELPEGWQLWDPARTFLLTGTELSEDAKRVLSTAATEGLIVPDAVIKTLNRFTKDYDHWAFNAISKVTNPWRTLVLTLSPGWYTRNFVGNVILASAEGVRLKDWQAAWHSFREKDELGRFSGIPFVQSGGLARETGVLADTSLIPRRGLREAISEEGRIRGTAQQISRSLLRINEVVDEFSRAAVYHRARNKLNMTPEEAWKRASEALVDYQALSPFERSAVRSVLPFYSWQKGILKVTMNQAMDHPARTGILMNLGQLNDEYIADLFGVDPEDVPDYYKHLIGDVNVRSYNPFADPSELLSPEGIIRSINPFIETAIRKGMGAPEFFPESYRVGMFGTPQADVDVPGELTSLVTRSPGGRILGTGLGPQTIGLGPIDVAKIRERLLRTRAQVRGIPNPESEVLPPRTQRTG